MARSDTENRAWALSYLRRLCRRGARVYTLISHVARSGMSRNVRVFVVSKGELVEITGPVATLTERPIARGAYGIRVGGCGFDAGFNVLHHLSYRLHGTDHAKEPKAGYTLRHERL